MPTLNLSGNCFSVIRQQGAFVRVARSQQHRQQGRLKPCANVSRWWRAIPTSVGPVSIARGVAGISVTAQKIRAVDNIANGVRDKPTVRVSTSKWLREMNAVDYRSLKCDNERHRAAVQGRSEPEKRLNEEAARARNAGLFCSCVLGQSAGPTDNPRPERSLDASFLRTLDGARRKIGITRPSNWISDRELEPLFSP